MGEFPLIYPPLLRQTHLAEIPRLRRKRERTWKKKIINPIGYVGDIGEGEKRIFKDSLSSSSVYCSAAEKRGKRREVTQSFFSGADFFQGKYRAEKSLHFSPPSSPLAVERRTMSILDFGVGRGVSED